MVNNASKSVCSASPKAFSWVASGVMAAMLGCAPAMAQSSADIDVPEEALERVVQKPVYGDDECEASANEAEIVVCVRFDESERYRIPPNLRYDPNNPKNQAWALRVRSLETVGAQGIGSCSPVGGGGVAGCTQQLINNAYAEKESNADAQAGRLIEQARQDRLSRIDEEAAIVEAAELERQSELEAYRKQQAAEDAAAAAQEGPDLVAPEATEDLAVPPQ